MAGGLACLLALASGCGEDVPQVAATNSPPPSGCPLSRGNLRLTPDSVGGLAAESRVEELRSACPSARIDTVGVGGTQPIAISISVPGATVSAVQTRYDAYEDTLHGTEPPDLWIAMGDSLRFPDGVLIPMRVGALRTLDPSSVVVIDHGDDGSGSYVVRCKYPEIAMVVSNVWPTFIDTGVVPFARIAVDDTTRVWRVEVDAKRIDPRITRACPSAPAT